MWKHLLLAAALSLMLIFLQAGEWVMLGAIVAMIILHELAHWFCARAFGYAAPVFTIGFGSYPHWVVGKLWGTEFRITPYLLGGYVQVDPGSDEFRARPAWTRLAVILSGVVLSIMLAFTLIFGLYVVDGERTVTPAGVSIHRIVGKDSPASGAGMLPGDKIIMADGAPINSYADLHRVMLNHADGSAAGVVVQRGDARLSLTVHPSRRGLLGATLSYRISTSYRPLSMGTAFERAAAVVWGMVAQLIVGVLMTLHLVPVTAGAPAGAGSAHGLLAMVQLGGLAFKQSLYSFISMVAYFNVNLALVNLLPIPGFDAGHLLFLGWEKVAGKPLRKDWQQKLERLTIIIVALVMVYSLFNDILHPVV
jgi:regulator of sigma E protease